MLDVTDRLIVIIGGGAVAARKAVGVIEAGGKRLRVVSPIFCPAIPDAVERRQKKFEPADIRDADLVFATTDDTEVNDAIVAEAWAMGIWVTRADSSEELPGDFVTPAKFQKGSITVTVSAGSAAMTVKIRDGLKQKFDPAWSAMADAMVTLRPLVLTSNLDAAQRRDLFRDLTGDEAMNILSTHGLPGLTQWLQNRIGGNK